MKLELALAVATQMCDPHHPATKSSNLICPDLQMIQVSNGQYLRSTNLDRAKRAWTWKEFVQEHAPALTPSQRANLGRLGIEVPATYNK